MHFEKKKFLSLTLRQRHKKCAELLRSINFSKDPSEHLDQYHQWLEWMDLDLELIFDHEEVSNRYHFHLSEAQVFFKEHHFLPKVDMGDRSHPRLPKIETHIYLDHIRSAHNVGSIIRTTEAFNLGNIYFSPQTPSTEHKQVQKASMGSWRWVSCYYEVSLESLPKPLIALETVKGAVAIDHMVFPESFTLAIGNEEYGCSKKTLQQAEAIVSIPLYGRKNSLNVANAFAIAAHTIRSQKINGKPLNKNTIQPREIS
ncbi:MAG: hypothetical protein Tsb0021_12930 [Chlamydiales bacterium]